MFAGRENNMCVCIPVCFPKSLDLKIYVECKIFKAKNNYMIVIADADTSHLHFLK